MFAVHSASGFYQASVSKGLLSTVVASSVILNFPLHQYKPYFVYNHSDVFSRFQIWRIFTSKLAFLDLKDLFICSLLIYYFRVFERRFGSRKYASYLLANCTLSTALEYLVIFICRTWEISLRPFPSGLLSMIYPLFVPYFCDIPRVPLSQVWGIPFTGKSVIYILGLQAASTSPESFIVAVCGIVSGILWRLNFLKIQSFFKIPNCFARLCDATLGRILNSRAPLSDFVPMGATLELQRQEQMEQMDQQMIWQSLRYNQQINRHNIQIGPPQAQNLANGPGIFGTTNNNPYEGLRQRHNIDNETNTNQELTEEQVQQLVDMGFNQEQVRDALRMSNNDISVATNILLQES
ncbi:hypothetical protein CHS0354_034958 [Potamilus streckersoni]|uniref:UBA domain-containing protein n=1 Tax=Potamilus streckersoni TaxID=2493646 RepID=A0AAE0SDZ0_9BIVA|nr:hypothetical protein CHS0354_034958 [Potamilus streckersoni]